MISEKTVNFSGDPQRAMQAADEYLHNYGYTVTFKTKSVVRFSGPGRKDRPMRDEFAGITDSEITIGANSISVRAELKYWKIAMVLLICGVGVVAIEFGKMYFGFLQPPSIRTAVMVYIFVELVFVPLVYFLVRKSLRTAIDQLLFDIVGRVTKGSTTLN